MSTGKTAHDSVHHVPRDVVDVLLWRMAARVIAVHQPQPGLPTRCASLLCAGQHYPCLPVRAAHRAQRISRRRLPAVTGASGALAPGQETVAVTDRSSDHASRHRFADWYTATRAAINPGRMRGRLSSSAFVRTPSTALAMTSPTRVRVGGVASAWVSGHGPAG